MIVVDAIFFEPTAVIRRTFSGLEPADVDIGPHAQVGVVEPQVGDVFVLGVNVTRTPRGDGRGREPSTKLAIEMSCGARSSDDIHVGLVQPQVEAGAVQVEELAELPPAHELAQLVDGRVVLEGVAGHEHHAGRLGRVDQAPARPPLAVASGFSMSTCLPAAIALSPRGAWVAGGVAMTTASTCGSASSRSA